MVMSETLFVTLSIWFLHFYIKSFENKWHKLTSIILAILATLARPFGFILILALGVNEIIKSKNKKTIIFISIVGASLSILLISYLIPNFISSISEKIASLSDLKNILYIIKALKNQANSLLITTTFLPLVLFISYINKDKEKTTKNIKYFLITFILLNFIVSAQHIYQYFLNGLELDLLTRYINVSTIFIIIFGMIFFEKNKDIEIHPIIFGIITIPLFFLTFDKVNHALTISLSPYYKIFNGFFITDTFFKLIFLPIAFLLISLLIFQKRKALKIAFIAITITQFILLLIWQINYTNKIEYNNPTFQRFKDTEKNILFLEGISKFQSRVIQYNFNYWRLLTLSSNNVTTMGFDDRNNNKPDITSTEWINLTNDKDYVISNILIELPVEAQTRYGENIYKLK